LNYERGSNLLAPKKLQNKSNSLFIYLCKPFMNPDIIAALEPYEEEGMVFKSCQREWIVVMERTENTKTNEARKGLIDSDYAKYRGSEFKVLNIINKYDVTKKVEEINSSHRYNPITYRIGEIVKSNFYDENIQEVCSTGIHFFLTFERAYMYENDSERIHIFDGAYKLWEDDGRLIGLRFYKDRKLHGQYRVWNADGTLQITGTYNNGKLDGAYTEYYASGAKKFTSTYSNGIKQGQEFHWDKHGVVYKCTNFTAGKVNGFVHHGGDIFMTVAKYEKNKMISTQNYVSNHHATSMILIAFITGMSLMSIITKCR
jgi:hypothetical protein